MTIVMDACNYNNTHRSGSVTAEQDYENRFQAEVEVMGMWVCMRALHLPICPSKISNRLLKLEVDLEDRQVCHNLIMMIIIKILG